MTNYAAEGTRHYDSETVEFTGDVKLNGERMEACFEDPHFGKLEAQGVSLEVPTSNGPNATTLFFVTYKPGRDRTKFLFALPRMESDNGVLRYEGKRLKTDVPLGFDGLVNVQTLQEMMAIINEVSSIERLLCSKDDVTLTLKESTPS